MAATLMALLVLPPLNGATVGTYNLYNILQLVADYGLVALALGITMIAREYDISTAGMYAVGGVVAVTAGIESPVLGLLTAVGIGIISGAVQGAAVAGLRMSSVPVALGGYLTLSGLARVLAGDRVVPYANFDVGAFFDASILGVFSIRSLIVLGTFAIAAIFLSFTTFGIELRAVGGDRRGARTAGVPVNRVLLICLIVSGALSALNGGLAAYSLSSANPNLGLAPLIFGTIAVLLGGVALSGGRGSVLGILAGVAAYATLRETLAILGTPDWLGNLVTGGLLLAVTIATAPDIARSLTISRSRWQAARERQRVGQATT
ncbi:ABC transporter permease [Microbacterium aurantiacum]|uniref:ABC transporter permease n=1 Tax=Microbacterium aurantiacum TaxID=162393 RepID=UPI003425BB0E